MDFLNKHNCTSRCTQTLVFVFIYFHSNSIQNFDATVVFLLGTRKLVWYDNQVFGE